MLERLYFITFKIWTYNLVEFPDVLISKFIGIIPSVIFPGKFALMISPADVGKSVIQYQATTHNYVEFMINFGLIGTIIIFSLWALV